MSYEINITDDGTSVTHQFPWKLHEILKDVELNNDTAIISWLPSGRAFKVHKRELFVERIMRQYFKQSKYKSFQRQLNLWGFQRVKHGPPSEKGGYYHPNFVRGQPDLCHSMCRMKIKGSSPIAASNNTAASGAAGASLPPSIAPSAAPVPASTGAATPAPANILPAMYGRNGATGLAGMTGGLASGFGAHGMMNGMMGMPNIMAGAMHGFAGGLPGFAGFAGANGTANMGNMGPFASFGGQPGLAGAASFNAASRSAGGNQNGNSNSAGHGSVPGPGGDASSASASQTQASSAAPDKANGGEQSGGANGDATGQEGNQSSVQSQLLSGMQSAGAGAGVDLNMLARLLGRQAPAQFQPSATAAPPPSAPASSQNGSTHYTKASDAGMTTAAMTPLQQLLRSNGLSGIAGAAKSNNGNGTGSTTPAMPTGIEALLAQQRQAQMRSHQTSQGQYQNIFDGANNNNNTKDSSDDNSDLVNLLARHMSARKPGGSAPSLDIQSVLSALTGGQQHQSQQQSHANPEAQQQQSQATPASSVSGLQGGSRDANGDADGTSNLIQQAIMMQQLTGQQKLTPQLQQQLLSVQSQQQPAGTTLSSQKHNSATSVGDQSSTARQMQLLQALLGGTNAGNGHGKATAGSTMDGGPNAGLQSLTSPVVQQLQQAQAQRHALHGRGQAPQAQLSAAQLLQFRGQLQAQQLARDASNSISSTGMNASITGQQQQQQQQQQQHFQSLSALLGVSDVSMLGGIAGAAPAGAATAASQKNAMRTDSSTKTAAAVTAPDASLSGSSDLKRLLAKQLGQLPAFAAPSGTAAASSADGDGSHAAMLGALLSAVGQGASTQPAPAASAASMLTGSTPGQASAAAAAPGSVHELMAMLLASQGGPNGASLSSALAAHSDVNGQNQARAPGTDGSVVTESASSDMDAASKDRFLMLQRQQQQGRS